MKITRYIILIVISSITFMSCLSKKPSPYQLSDDIDRQLTSKWKPNQPGMAVFVWEDGKVLSENYMGKTGQLNGQSLSSSTSFRMASVSKQFTATAILMLEKQGKLSLNQTLAHFFPSLPSWASTITLQQLLTHTSGIVDYESLMGDAWSGQILDEEIVPLLQNTTETYFQPGEKFSYSNTAYCLLSLIVEKVANQSYASFMKEHLFTPLGMVDTFVYEREQANTNRALGFRKQADGSVVQADQSTTSATKGDGAVYTSVRDYQKWFNALRDKSLIDLEKYLTQYGYDFPEDPTQGYGFGWFYKKLEESEKAFELTHTGSTSGFSSIVVAVPEKDILVLYFSNIAQQHGLFNELQPAIKEHTSYDWRIDWQSRHELTN